MTFLRIYLAAYVLLVGGAFLALARGGVLQRIPTLWVALFATVAVACGLLLVAVSTPRRPVAAEPREIQLTQPH